MKRKPFLWIYETMLIFGLIVGPLSMFHSQVPIAVVLFAVAINLFLQYGVIKAIRAKPINQLPPVEQALIAKRRQAILKPLLIGCFSLFALLMINMGLFISHTYSIQTFGFVSAGAAAIAFCFFMTTFTRAKKIQE